MPTSINTLAEDDKHDSEVRLGKCLIPSTKRYHVELCRVLSSPPAEHVYNCMQGCKDPGGQPGATAAANRARCVFGFGEVEVLELFLKIAIALRHKELCVSQFEVVFVAVLPRNSVKEMTTASDGPQNIPLITYWLKIKLSCGVQTAEEVLLAELCPLLKDEHPALQIVLLVLVALMQLLTEDELDTISQSSAQTHSAHTL